MDCNEVQHLLEALLAGTLPPALHQAMDAHAVACVPCRVLVACAVGAPSVDVPPGLAESILRRTTGPACGRASEMLDGFLDGTLPGPDRELVALHVGFCPTCAAQARALARLAADLPALAEIRPASPFVERVLARTSRSPRRRFAAWVRRWPELGRDLLLRPRFAVEGAYFGALLLVAVFGLLAPAGLAERVRSVARANPMRALAAPAEQLASRVGSRVESRVESLTRQVRAQAERGIAPVWQAPTRVRQIMESLWHGEDDTTEMKESPPRSDPGTLPADPKP